MIEKTMIATKAAPEIALITKFFTDISSSNKRETHMGVTLINKSYNL